MRAIAKGVDELLRGEESGPPRLLLSAGAMVVFGLVYGAAMGSFAGTQGPRFLQMLFSAAKVPLLLGVTFVIALPSFYVLNVLLGLGRDFPRVMRALFATQAALTVVLASLAPLTLFWYASTTNYSYGILFNAGAFALASAAGQWRLRRYYRPLIATNRRHRAMQVAWLLIYAFVGIQMGWTLRPFIGDPSQSVQFFRAEPFSNAYVVILQLLLSPLHR